MVGYELALSLTAFMRSPPFLISLVVTLSYHTLTKTNNALCKVNNVEMFASLLRNSKRDQLHYLHYKMRIDRFSVYDCICIALECKKVKQNKDESSPPIISQTLWFQNGQLDLTLHSHTPTECCHTICRPSKWYLPNSWYKKRNFSVLLVIKADNCRSQWRGAI